MTAGEGEVVINIPPPVLWGDYPEKEPEEEVKENTSRDWVCSFRQGCNP